MGRRRKATNRTRILWPKEHALLQECARLRLKDVQKFLGLYMTDRLARHAATHQCTLRVTLPPDGQRLFDAFEAFTAASRALLLE
jgi:hypothetical protein